MVIRFGEKWMLKPVDRRNWSLYELRSADPNNHKTKSTEPKWFKCDEYFQSLSHAVRRAFEYELREDPGEVDIGRADEIVARIEAIADRLSRVEVTEP